MRQQKTWLTIHFIEGDVGIEATLNYETKKFSLTHGSNDENVTFRSDQDERIKTHLDRAKCVMAALKYIQSELNL